MSRNYVVLFGKRAFIGTAASIQKRMIMVGAVALVSSERLRTCRPTRVPCSSG